MSQSKTIEELEKELEKMKESHRSMWDTYGSELCAGDMIRQEEKLEKEILKLKRYILILYWAKKAYLNYFFSIESDIQEAEKKLSFIIFLKKQFLEWISTHNIKTLN